VRVMHQSVKDGVAQSGVSDDAVPFLHGDLAGDEGRSQVVSVVRDFQEVPALFFGQVASPQSSMTSRSMRA
jgi:hypothetical protein